MRLGVGVTCYNDFDLTAACVSSVLRNGAGVNEVCVVDDGSRYRSHLAPLQDFLSRRGVRFVRHEVNRGIPAAWNSCCENLDTDIVCLLNNDIVITSPETFPALRYFIENNEGIGGVGFPLVQVNSQTGEKSSDPSMQGDVLQAPGKVGCAVGCSFGFKKKVWREVGGFWEALVSFHEEFLFGFQMAERGYVSYMLPFPAVEHYGSRTFAANPELAVTTFDDTLANRQEYIRVLSDPRFHERLPHLRHQMGTTGFIWDDERGTDLVYRMDYSRFLFAQWYGALDHYAEPQVGVHRRIVDPLPEPDPLRWINREGRVCVREKGEVRYAEE